MNLVDQFLYTFSRTSELDLVASIIILLAGFVSGLVISLIYNYNTRAFTVEVQFRFTLTVICMIVALVMAVIGSNITLSLGLIGALSIIRFRAVVKNTVDMTYLFWSIATGLAVGAQAWEMALASLVGISIIITLLSQSRLLTTVNHNHLVTIQVEPNVDQVEISRWIQKYAPGLKLVMKSANVDVLSQLSEFTYEATLGQPGDIEALLDKVREQEGIKGVTVLHPETNLYL